MIASKTEINTKNEMNSKCWGVIVKSETKLGTSGTGQNGRGVDSVPNKGIASETCGRVSATRLRNTVSERRIVTPAIKDNVNNPNEAHHSLQGKSRPQVLVQAYKHIIMYEHTKYPFCIQLRYTTLRTPH